MLAKIIQTLNSIEVHGKENLNKLLACICALEQIAGMQKKEEKDEESDGDE